MVYKKEFYNLGNTIPATEISDKKVQSQEEKTLANMMQNKELYKFRNSLSGIDISEDKRRISSAYKSEIGDISRRGNTKSSCSSLLYHYALDTSFHGPKQFTEPQPFITRRVIWLLIFLAGTAIFLMQTVMSIQRYYTFPVSVNVKVNYNTSITFPTVTICNGNAFRSTKAYDYGYYDLISEVYTNPLSEDMSRFAPTPALDKLYIETGHNISDLIISCIWDNKPCLQNDFAVTMTDLGRCYTFNSGMGTSQRKAYQTGTNGGLKLQLNTEQYEYMAGPNTGAGLKVLIHNPDGIPLVKDHGLAIPPGSHGLIGIKTSVISNLPPRYGICNDSMILDYFNDYTVENCYTNCKEKYFEERCNCRDIYMPPKQGLPAVCNIDLHNTCMQQAEDEFSSRIKETCDCPVPCKSILHQSSVSYASISNFDIDTLMRGNSTALIQKKFIHAREITQRVNKAIVESDKVHITRFSDVVSKIDTAFHNMETQLEATAKSLNDYKTKFSKRIKFHDRKALGGLQFVLEKNFIRGWEVFKERAFHHVILNFMEFPKLLKTTINESVDNETESLSDQFSRKMLLAPIFAQFKGRKDLLNRTKYYINETNTAFLSEETPLLTYKWTYERRYDLSLISPHLVNAGYWNWDNVFNKLNKFIGDMDSAIDVLLEVGGQYIETGIFNDNQFHTAEAKYVQGVKNFNYRMYQYEFYVINRPLNYLIEIRSEFDRITQIVEDSYRNVEWKISQIDTILHTSIDQWKNVVKISKMADNYLDDKTLMKTPLGKAITEKQFLDKIQLLSFNFEEIRSRVSQLLDVLTVLASSYKAVWQSMLSEPRTHKFYNHIHEDCQAFLSFYHANNETDTLTDYFKIFRDMLFRMPMSEIQQMDPKDVIAALNGDLAGLNHTIFFMDFDKEFEVFHHELDLSTFIGSKDVLFAKYIADLQSSLSSFINGNKIGESFFQQNFMTLDVFMKELSYEEITQQEAYDVTQMLSEIGGSMGLFIGGSVLSAFEFLDVFIHHAARVVFSR